MKKRKIFAGLNTTISVLLVLAIACSVYYIAERHPIRKDFTADKFQTLSPKTLKILKGLDADVTAVVFIRKDSGELSLVSDALREYARNSNRFKYKAIDPVLNPAEVRRYSISREGIVFVSGGRQKFVSKDDIFTFHPDMYGGQSPPEYAGEAVFTNAIVSITGAGSTVACFTVGHGERDINGTDEQGYSAMRDNLVNSNYEIRRIELSTEKKVSERCDVVGVLGPTKFFSKPELDALDVYLSGGGHVLFLVDPVAETGLNAILERRDVSLDNDVVIDTDSFFGNDPLTPAPKIEPHAITEPLLEQRLTVSLPEARSISVKGKAPGGGSVAVLLRGSAKSWGETDLKNKKPAFDPKTDVKGPVVFAAAAAWGRGTRLVVVGDSDFCSNGMTDLASNPFIIAGAAGNPDFFLNAVNWLAGRKELISIAPKPMELKPLEITGPKRVSLIFVCAVLAPLVIGFIGLFVWVRRRSM